MVGEPNEVEVAKAKVERRCPEIKSIQSENGWWLVRGIGGERWFGPADSEDEIWLFAARQIKRDRLPAQEEPRQVIVAVHGDHGNLAVFDNRDEADDYIRVEGNGSEVVDLSRVSRDGGVEAGTATPCPYCGRLSAGMKYHEQQCNAPIPSATEKEFEGWLKHNYPDIAMRSNNAFRSMAKGMRDAWTAAKGVSR